MDFSAPHTGFVIAAYAVTIAALLALVIVTIMRGRRLSREAADLEARRGRGERK
jgi:heme exporter protein CcmD